MVEPRLALSLVRHSLSVPRLEGWSSAGILEISLQRILNVKFWSDCHLKDVPPESLTCRLDHRDMHMEDSDRPLASPELGAALGSFLVVRL